jgi:hypothetical protein
VDGKFIAGHYYYRDLTAASEPDEAGTAVSGIGGTVPSS